VHLHGTHAALGVCFRLGASSTVFHTSCGTLAFVVFLSAHAQCGVATDWAYRLPSCRTGARSLTTTRPAHSRRARLGCRDAGNVELGRPWRSKVPYDVGPRAPDIPARRRAARRVVQRCGQVQHCVAAQRDRQWHCLMTCIVFLCAYLASSNSRAPTALMARALRNHYFSTCTAALYPDIRGINAVRRLGWYSGTRLD